uniref:CRAL-TRIO domain-containing protein n=1 Tax=Amphiprion ocellaris TaxID=80972 RepID=A0A3Q1BJZ7_AMPOC
MDPFVSGDDNFGRKLISFSSCLLPPSHLLNHRRLLEYLRFTLDQYVEMDYILVCFHHRLRSRNKPSLNWLHQAESLTGSSVLTFKSIIMLTTAEGAPHPNSLFINIIKYETGS